MREKWILSKYLSEALCDFRGGEPREKERERERERERANKTEKQIKTDRKNVRDHVRDREKVFLTKI